MILIDKPISKAELNKIAKVKFGNLVKAVGDVEKKIMAIDAELHADEEAALLEKGSKQEYLWGINLYPELEEPDWVEFDSMINVRPSSGNRSRGVDDPSVRKKIVEVVNTLIS